MQNLYNDIAKILEKDERLFAEGKILKNKATELAIKLDKDLLKLLLESKTAKDNFFIEVAGSLVFDKDKFIKFVNNKEFLPDSFTAFKNHIGLTDGRGDYLKDSGNAVLVWPYKDCVLEGGQDKEDTRRDEIFYNEILAPDEIDRLYEPKVLTNFKKFDKTGEHPIKEITDQDNLIIKGNNLLALHSLKKRYRGQVKLIYIDPPYNTGSDGFNYNDSFNHSSWLVFMKNRLEIAKQLLSNDGAIYVQIDYNEAHYLKVLMDEVFERDNFQREIIWHLKTTSGFKSKANNWTRDHDTILFYSKTRNNLFKDQYKEYGEKYLKRFKKTDKDGRKYRDDRSSGIRQYADELNGIKIGDVWNDIMSFQQASTSQEYLKFAGQKPEELLKRIIEASTDTNDIVLDYHAGTGTTLAVAHKLGRRFIGIEQMDYIHDLPEARLKKVIKGEQGGISKTVNWKGGGSFIYAELKQWNEAYMQAIQDAKTVKEIAAIYKKMRDEAFFRYEVDLSKFDDKKFADLELPDQKKVLMECLDKNHLYVNLGEMEDATYKISAEDKRINRQFYGK